MTRKPTRTTRLVRAKAASSGVSSRRWWRGYLGGCLLLVSALVAVGGSAHIESGTTYEFAALRLLAQYAGSHTVPGARKSLSVVHRVVPIVARDWQHGGALRIDHACIGAAEYRASVRRDSAGPDGAGRAKGIVDAHGSRRGAGMLGDRQTRQQSVDLAWGATLASARAFTGAVIVEERHV